MKLRLFAAAAILCASHACGRPAPQAEPSPAAAPAGAPPGDLQIGMNLAGIVPYSGQQPLIDRSKTIEWTAEWQPIAAADLGPDGFPTRIPLGRKELNSSTTLDPGSKRYVLLYSGSPAVSVYQPHDGKNTITWGPGVSNADYSRKGRIEFTADGNASWSINGFDPQNPLRDLHLLRADQEKAWRAGAIINPDWLARFGRHFSPYRMMDWSCTNSSRQAHWDDRPKVSAVFYGCVPAEVQIALANASDADLWLNVPHLADDDYVRQLATLVKETLKPGLRLHLEYSNEVWNGQFDQSKWAQAQADKLWGGGKTVPWGNEIWYGYRSAQIMAIARPILGDRLLGVVGTWPGWGNSDIDDAIAAGVAKSGKGTIASLFREYAVTTYFGNELSYAIGNEPDRPVSLAWANGGPAGLDAAFDEIFNGGKLKSDDSLAFLRKSYVRHAAQARKWGLNMVAYEGGFHIFLFMAPDPEKPARLALVTRMLADPRMGQAYARMIADFRAAGGTVLANFNDVGAIGIFGAWGVLPNLAETTPRYEALRAASGR